MQEYQEAQHEKETDDPYLLDTKVFTPQTRTGFYDFIQKEYATFALPPPLGTFDENACEKLGKSIEEGIESFYIRNSFVNI